VSNFTVLQAGLLVNHTRPGWRKIWLGAALLSVILILTSCAPSKLPGDAKEALMDHWASFPSSPGIEHHIIRAWQGASPTQDTSGLAPELETWCVETRISAPSDPSVDGEKLVWIVIRGNQEARWNAALLATMSSLWPYEACGSGP
jgi:hypothetical protein